MLQRMQEHRVLFLVFASNLLRLTRFSQPSDILQEWLSGSDPSIPSNMYAGRQQRSSKGIFKLHVLKNNKISSPDCIMQRILWITSDLVNFGDIQLITSNSMYRI